MNKSPFQYRFPVRAMDADAHNRLKISSVFNFMQIVAGMNANELGFGYEHLVPKGYFWILSRVILEWHGNVGIDNDIMIETWPKGVEKLFALRDFRIYSHHEECRGKATSAWLMIDSHNRRPLMLSHNMFNLPDFGLIPAIDEFPGKIAEPPGKSLLALRKAVYSDIDINQHVNNAKYLEYIFDALPGDVVNQYKTCRLQINYLKELHPGESFTMYHKQGETFQNQHYLDAENESGQKTFQVLLDFDYENMACRINC